jgi:tetratricopeptide (TPR) repeat protein
LLERAETHLPRLNWSRLQRAQLARNLAEAYYAVGQLNTCLDYLKDTLARLDCIIPRPDDSEFWLARITAIDTLPFDAALRQRPAAELTLMIDAAIELGYLYPEQTVHPLAALPYVALTAYLQSTTVQDADLANTRAMLALALLTVGLPAAAQQYAVQAQETVEHITSASPQLANALSNLAYYWTFVGDWEHAQQDSERSARLYAEFGDFIKWRAALMNRAAATEWQGRFAEGLRIRQQEYAAAQQANAVIGKIRALAGVGQMQATLGQTAEAVATFEHRAQLIDSIAKTGSTRWTYLAMAYWRNGDIDRARQYLPDAVAEIRKIPSPTAHDMFSISNTAEVSLGLWELEPAQHEPYHTYAAEAIRCVRLYADLFPAGRGHMLVFIGLYDWLCGNEAVAMELWHEALAVAAAIGTPYAAARAHLEIARHLASDLTHQVQRQEHLTQAQGLFETMGTRWDLERLRRYTTAG